MAWLRLDDGFTSNQKIAQLTDRQFRVWIRLLCHCARSQNPIVNRVVIREVSGMTLHMLLLLKNLRLLDENGDDYEIHDWHVYQPHDATNASRQAKYRQRRNVTSNGESNASDCYENRYADRYETVTSRAGTRTGARPVLPYEVKGNTDRSEETAAADATAANPNGPPPLTAQRWPCPYCATEHPTEDDLYDHIVNCNTPEPQPQPTTHPLDTTANLNREQRSRRPTGE